MIVRVYRNLRASKKAGKPVYSIQDARTGRVVNHSDAIVLRDVRFVVSAAGRQRVLREGRKNVHAFAVGELVCAHGPSWPREKCRQQVPAGAWRRVVYDPYERGHFYDGYGNVWENARFVQLDQTGLWALA